MIHKFGWMCESVGMAQTVCVLPPAEDRKRLLAIVADRNRPLKHVRRAHIVLCSADCLPVQEVARRARVSRPAVWRWQARYAEQGVEGLLRDKTRKPGRAPLSAKVVAKVLDLTCSEPPGQATHWTGRAMAKAVGVSLRAVQRLWEAPEGTDRCLGAKAADRLLEICDRRGCLGRSRDNGLRTKLSLQSSGA